MSENGDFISLETVYLSFAERTNFVIRRYIKLKFASSKEFVGSEALEEMFIMHVILLKKTLNDTGNRFSSVMLPVSAKCFCQVVEITSNENNIGLQQIKPNINK